MTQYKAEVEKQAKLIEAEKWAEGVKAVHGHSMNSMWYDTRPQDTKEHNVLDIEYNDGLIERRLHTGEVVFFGNKLTGSALVDEWERNNVE